MAITYLFGTVVPYLAIIALLAWALLVWLPARRGGTKALAFLACAALLVAVTLYFEVHLGTALRRVGSITFGLDYRSGILKMLSLIGPAFGLAMAVALFFVMLTDPRGKLGEGYYRAITAMTGLVLFLASGALLVGFLVE